MKKMYIFLSALLLAFCIASTSFAAVNNKYFSADRQSFDPETGLYTISGNIDINVGNGSITGDKAQVKLSTLEFFGTGGWYLRQDDVTFKGESVYVVFNKSVVMIEDGADFQRPNLQISSDKVDYNWKSKIAEFKGNVKVVREGKAPELFSVAKYNVKSKEFVQ